MMHIALVIKRLLKCLGIYYAMKVFLWVATVRAARALGPGHTLVTVLCDSGQRHLTKFWDEDHIHEHWNLQATAEGLEFLEESDGQP
jgi:hypothetical protein